uniref:Doublecortin domain containing 2 n=1 Tax=Nothoprocta perdicaria TaxID=30464 RepID=A0A8C6ZV49_NOTPE
GAGGAPTVKSVLVYRNGDPFFPGRRIVVHEKKVSNFEVFLKEVTGGVKAPFGAVRNIYTPRGGHRIRQLQELQSGEQYVAGGRETASLLMCNRGVPQGRACAVPGPGAASHPCNPGTLVAPPNYLTLLYFSLIANGDLISPVVRLLIPRKTLNQWDHILEMVTEKVTLRSGAVHRLYTLDGKLVQSGSELENGQFYVAVGRDKFKKLPYGDLLFSKSTIRKPQGKVTKPCRNSVSTQVHQPAPSEAHHALYHTVSQFDFTFYHPASFPIIDEGIYKAGEKRSEMLGAVEVQEDEDTRVEVPLDQVMIEL